MKNCALSAQYFLISESARVNEMVILLFVDCQVRPVKLDELSSK